MLSTRERRTIGALRLSAQRIDASDLATPGAVVRWMFAMQAQDYAGAKWSVGLRLPGSTDAAIESVIESREFDRSWPMRGTLHFIAGEDLGWMLRLTTPRLLKGAATRRRQLELNEADLGLARDVAIGVLSGDRLLERNRLLEEFESAGLSTTSQRGYHLLWHLAQTGVIVFGPARGKQQTFALLDEWVPFQRKLERDESLGELAGRYFRSHGPATIRDFAWWASLTLGEARAGLAIARPALEEREFGGAAYFLAPALQPAGHAVHALSGFDEYLLGYQDRSAVISSENSARIVPGGNGMFLPTIVAGGEVVGTWRRTARAKEVLVDADWFSQPSATTRKAFVRAAAGYGRFIGKPAMVDA